MILKVTPVLVFEGGEVAGTPKYFQGEDVRDNYTPVSWKNGGVFTQKVVFPYDERANLSTLVLRVEAVRPTSAVVTSSKLSATSAP